MILTMISPPLFYQNVGKLTLILISPDPSFSFWFYKHLSLLFSYWSIASISYSSNGSFCSHLDPLIYSIFRLNSPFLFALKTVCLMLPKLESAIFLFPIGILYVVHLPDIFLCTYYLHLFLLKFVINYASYIHIMLYAFHINHFLFFFFFFLFLILLMHL